MRKSNVFLTVVCLALLVAACHKKTDNGDSPEVLENNRIDAWILEEMQTYYLWNDRIPSKTDMNLAPADYFESLLYTPEDRFSWIQENYTDLLNSFSGVAEEGGYEFFLAYWDAANTQVAGCITYVKHGSPAEAAGLKRGQLFLTVNNTQMTAANYADLLNNAIYQPHTLGVITDLNTAAVKNVSINTVVFQENPVFLDTVYQLTDKKVGYLVYNFFAPDNGDGSNAYDLQLNDIFANFKTEAIDALILDLRYNGGGYVSSAVHLAGMISNQTSKDLFSIDTYNDILSAAYKQHYGADYNKTYFQDDIVQYRYNSNGNATGIISQTPINHLGVSKLYVITSTGTASASELVINALTPYMGDANVTLVGDTTYGKNVGSITIYDTEDATNKWGMQPIVVKTANSSGFSDYGRGFAPDVRSDELNDWGLNVYADETTLLPLGDTAEVMLNAALATIEGRALSRRAATPVKKTLSTSQSLRPERQNMIIPKKKPIFQP